MKSSLRHFLLLPAVILTVSCVQQTNRNNEAPLARVNDKYLYPADLSGIFNHARDRNDSIRIIRTFVDKWVKKELILSKAEMNLSTGEMMSISKQLEETRTSLIIFHYQQQLLKQRLDTLVGQEEINQYYQANTSNFLLDKPIVKALFIKIPRMAPNLDRVRQWYRSGREQDLNELESYCFQYANKFDDFGEKWILFDQLAKQLPSEIANPDQHLRYNRTIEMQDSAFHYFVNLREYQLTGTASPVSFVEEKIRNIIINKRKIEFIKELENNIFNDGLNGNEFDIYYE